MASASGEAEEGFSLPGDFAHTLFEASRESLENECHQLLEPFCNEVKGACEAAAKAGATKVECTAAIRKDAGVEAVFYEELKAVFDKTGVHVIRGVEYTTGVAHVVNHFEGNAERVDRLAAHLFGREAAPEVPRGVDYSFVWGTVGNDGLLHETEPMEKGVAIKPNRGNPYNIPMQNLNHTEAEDAQIMHHYGHGSLN